MSSSIVKNLAKYRPWLMGAASVALLSISYSYKGISQNFKELGKIRDGIQICGARTAQTFTASVIGDTSSIYMDSNFTGSTEECFAEATSLVEDSSFLSSNVLKKLNVLNTDVNWFHESLRATGSGFSITESKEDPKENISSKYSEVESNLTTALELLDTHTETLSSSMNNLKLALMMAALVLIFSGSWEAYDRRRVSKVRKEIEDEAFNELTSDDHSTASKVEEIIVNALELNEMTHCSRLITTYRQNVLKSMEDNRLSSRMKQFTPPVRMLNDEQTVEEVEEVAQIVWQESDALDEVEVQTSSDIAEIATKVVDHLSNKLIAEGLVIDMDVKECQVQGEAETVEQVLYYVVLDAIQNARESNFVRVKGKTLGAVYSFEIESRGEGKETATNTSVQIAKELLFDMNGRMEINNIFNDQAEVDGRSTRLIMKAITKSDEAPAPTVRRIERGTKREILERMQQNLDA